MSDFKHVSVLLNEALEALSVDSDGVYVDCTYGRGGHSAAILKQLNASGKLIIIDKDPSAIAHAKRHYADDSRVLIEHASFSSLASILSKHHYMGKVSGILFDLGVSSPQLEDQTRGFSFRGDGPLDMRMNSEQGITASDWLATVKEAELSRILKEYGEERFAKRIAHTLCEQRQLQPFTRTKQLADCIRACYPAHLKHGKHQRIDPATKTFQAIRIVINEELIDIEKALEMGLQALTVKGRLVVISFHSLEDRMVKRFMRHHARGQDYPKGLPIKASELGQTVSIVSKPIRAHEQEVALNPRSRSAIMRVAEKIA